MNTALNNNNSSTTSNAAEPQPAVTTPEQIAEQLRALRVAIPQATLTTRQKAGLRKGLTASNDVVQAQVSVLPVLEGMSVQLGATADDVRKVGEEANRWLEVISELRAMLREAEGTALLHQQKLHRLATPRPTEWRFRCREIRNTPYSCPTCSRSSACANWRTGRSAPRRLRRRVSRR